MRKFFKEIYEAWVEARMRTVKARMRGGYWY
jgi:hypothetical protein